MKKVPFVYFWCSLVKILLRKNVLLSDKCNYCQFVITAFGKRNLMTSLPRSGTNYTKVLINVAYDLSKNGDGNYYYNNGQWQPKYWLFQDFDWRAASCKDLILTSKAPIIYHTHHLCNNIVSLQKRNMKTVILVRNLYDQLPSRLIQTKFGIDRQDEFINSQYFCDPIKFLNSWGKYLKKSENCFVIKYESLLESPLETLRLLSNIWDLQIDDEYFIRSIELCKKDVMLSKVPEDNREKNERVSFRKYKFEEAFTRRNRQKINKIIISKLRYDFGYKY